MRLTPRQCWAASRPRAQTQIPAQKAGLLTYPSYSREFDLGYPRTRAVGVIPLVSFRLIWEANHDEIGHFGFQLWGSGVLSTLKPGIILYCPKLRQPCGFPSDLNQYPFLMGRVGCSAIFNIR